MAHWDVDKYERLTARALQLAGQLQGKTSARKLEEMFAPSFLSVKSVPSLQREFRRLRKQAGAVVAVEPILANAENVGLLSLLTDNSTRLRVHISLEVGGSGRITELRYEATELKPDGVCLLEALKELPGQTGLCVWELRPQGPRSLLEHEAERPLSMASVFKLYVLGALLLQKCDWQRVLNLSESTRGFPSGMLQEWPVGTPMTVQTLATLMISISDNTAADTLMRLLGDTALAEAVQAMGHAQPELLTPFLSTLDLVRLKSDESASAEFLAGNREQRRQLLDRLARRPRQSVGLPTEPGPVEVGWWAAPADICRALDWLWRQTRADHPVRQLLSVNPGLPISCGVWPWLGFKGGGDQGVVAASWLAQHRSGAVYAIAAAWNDPEGSVDEGHFFELLESLFWALPEKLS